MSHKNLKHVPYCYLIGWPKLNKFYYGVKFGTSAHPSTFWESYFTSSSLVSKYRANYGEPSIIQIRKVFTINNYRTTERAQQAAVDYENKVISRMNMVLDDRYLNCSNNARNRTGSRITNHTKYRNEKFGQYHSFDGIEKMRAANRLSSKLNNPMSNPTVKEKHLNSIARKIGYLSHQEYLETVKSSFEKYKTIKVTADKTGHSQYTIRHLLIKNFGNDWLAAIRASGLQEARCRSAISNKLRTKRSQNGGLNYNAHVWKAVSTDGEVHIIKGHRIQFCKDNNIGTSLDPLKPHLRGYWRFEKLCKVKDYTG